MASTYMPANFLLGVGLKSTRPMVLLKIPSSVLTKGKTSIEINENQPEKRIRTSRFVPK